MADICCLIVCVCFFQAEDGIRDLVRSRGLGDVYKRQEQCILQSIRDTTLPSQDQIIGYQFVCEGSDTIDQFLFFEDNPWRKIDFPKFPNKNRYVPVSYTHLTLPTSDLV